MVREKFDAGLWLTRTYWWLRSPNSNNDNNAWIVNNDGDINNNNVNNDNNAVRPDLPEIE